METYASILDVRNEFKSVLEKDGTLITSDRIQEFLLQANTVINSHVGTLYSLPVTGVSSVNQKDTFTIATVTDATDYFFSISAFGETTEYKVTSGTGATAASIKALLIAKVNADKNRLIEVENIADPNFTTTSRVLGTAYVISNLSTGTGAVTSVNSIVAVLGSYGLRLLRKIETELAACKIAGILRTKIAKVLDASGVKQEIKDGSCSARAMRLLKDIKGGTLLLDGADLISSGGGLESHNQVTGYESKWDIEKRQW